jgi:hypothetical protein
MSSNPRAERAIQSLMDQKDDKHIMTASIAAFLESPGKFGKRDRRCKKGPQ